MDAARHWALGGKQDLTAQNEALKAMGVEADLSEREKECVDLDIWPENEMPLDVLIAMKTQWLRGGMDGAICGLNYGALSPVMRLLRIPYSDQPEVFASVQVLENAMLSAIYAEG